MTGETGGPVPGVQDPCALANDLVSLMPRDLVFAPRFLGQSQERLRRHFRGFVSAELAARGLTADSHPMLPAFVEQHAAVLADFVVIGVSLPHQLRIEEVEQLMRDRSGLLRGDLWDQIKTHVAEAEARFRLELPQVAAMLGPEQEKKR